MNQKISVKNYLTQISKATLSGDYVKGELIAQTALEQFPNHMELTYQYAKMIGDGADTLPPAKMKKEKTRAIKLLKIVLKNIHEIQKDKQFGVYLNYFYQSEDFKGMVKFGKKCILSKDKTEKKNGYYAIGIGSTLVSQSFYQSKKFKLSQTWAEAGIEALKKYSLKSEKYYYPHYVNALANAIAGKLKVAFISLEKAAKLSHREIEDEEFSDVLKIILN